MQAKLMLSGCILFLASIHCMAAKDSVDLSSRTFIQSIQVINLLSNTNLADPGMTTTSVIVKYFNGHREPCWISTLNYQEDTTIHAGPWDGCVDKVTELVINPILVADKLKTYDPSITVPIDANNYSNQITIIQDEPPTFSAENGLVTKSGSIKVKVQSQLLK